MTEEIRDLLEDRFDFVWVEGEISNFGAPSSGHYYMVLKDEKAQIRAVMFRMQARYLKFVPENGMKALAQGRIGVYRPRGEYQLILDYLEPLGVGALALAFEQLKKKLASQGVFDEDKKRPLPFLPQRVAVITSPTGAAIRDFLKVISRRFANIEITVVPVRVQGDEATADIVKAIQLVNDELKADVIVLTRGGGSLEDLWAFNQESLALAIRKSRIPVLSAVGHEIDVTISDLAADFRAPTPSAAAELLVAEKETLVNRLEDLASRLVSGVTWDIKNMILELNRLEKSLKDPRKRLVDMWMRLDEIHSRLVRSANLTVRHGKQRLNADARALVVQSPLNLITVKVRELDFKRHSLMAIIKSMLRERRANLSLLAKGIKDLSPAAILKRGYSITRRLPEKSVLRDTSNVTKGDKVQVLLAEGELKCLIEQIAPGTDGRGA